MIIVTGGAGFIGSNIIKALNNRGRDDILVVDILGTDAKWKNLIDLKFADYVEAEDFIEMAIEGELDDSVETIFHMGACSDTSETDCTYLVKNNYVPSAESSVERISDTQYIFEISYKNLYAFVTKNLFWSAVLKTGWIARFSELTIRYKITLDEDNGEVVVKGRDLIDDMFDSIPDGIGIRPLLKSKDLLLMRTVMVEYSRIYRGDSRVYRCQDLLKRMLRKVS